MRFLVAILPLSVALAALGGCTRTLNVGYTEPMATRGPLSSVAPRRIDVGAFADKRTFADKRPETTTIGYQRNALGHNVGDIVTSKPVPDIVREALIAEFKKNGHEITTGERDFVLSGDVTTFWFEWQYTFLADQFSGASAITLNVVDGRTGTTLLTRSYQGHTEKSMLGRDPTWERAMNEALQRMVRDVSTDLQLIRVLKGGM